MVHPTLSNDQQELAVLQFKFYIISQPLVSLISDIIPEIPNVSAETCDVSPVPLFQHCFTITACI